MDDRQKSGCKTLSKQDAAYELCQIQGRRYQKTGNIKSLKPTFEDYDFMRKHGMLPGGRKTREAKAYLLQTRKARHNGR